MMAGELSQREGFRVFLKEGSGEYQMEAEEVRAESLGPGEHPR